MKKICFIVDSIFTIGGVQRVTAVIAKELAKEYDVTILTFDKTEKKDTTMYGLNEANITYRFIQYPKVGELKNKLCKTYSGIYLKLQPQSRWSSNLYARSSFPSELRQVLLAELKREDFDIIIGDHAPLAARLATLKKDLPKAKLIGWLHNSYEALFGDNSHYYIGAKRRRHYIYQFRKLDDVVVLCQDDANRFHQYDHQFLPTVIYNPLTLKSGSPSQGKSKRFLTVGRFTPLHKGIDLLIEAFHLFAQKNHGWMLDIVGEGKEEPKYRALISKYELEDRITIHPFTNQIQNYYSNAQVYVLSSRWEGMPLVLVEAMSHGLPIVTSDLPVCQEILSDFGLYFENGNIEGLAQRLVEATHIDWQTKSQEALKIAQRFDLHLIVEQWKQLLE
ncbi:Glycosyltransferase involved in cell wall bisynthesis [Prevotella sp. ne3005]|uniref:glycosyltransferase family 4 protein n=1 Tax=Prevotella sp. ne3005 TaxID=1761887 RepID=UPI0008C8B6BA|nr:glycosyltransferase family 4 protein [Prevotella sp. ne3005]SEM68535.1 Glycosyltransferase involved in cell wall bisynthesis [Prevotella sp. ne3005]